MRTGLLLVVALLAGSTAGLNVWGQNVYRCGDTYTDALCPGGVAIDADDSRTAAQKAQSDATAIRTSRSADQLERERLALEKTQPAKPPTRASVKTRAVTAGMTGAAEKRAANRKKAEYFTAAAPKKANPADKSTGGK